MKNISYKEKQERLIKKLNNANIIQITEVCPTSAWYEEDPDKSIVGTTLIPPFSIMPYEAEYEEKQEGWLSITGIILRPPENMRLYVRDMTYIGKAKKLF